MMQRLQTIQSRTMQNLRPRNRIGGDCVILAITFATGAAYTDVEDLCKTVKPAYDAEKRTKGGMPMETLIDRHPAMFGHTFKPHNKGMIRMAQFMRDNPIGTFLIRIAGHALVIKDGVRYDGNDSSIQNFVLGAWKVEKVVAQTAEAA